MDKAFIAAFTEINASDESTVYSKTPSEVELRDEYRRQFDALSTYGDATTFEDQELALHAKTLLLALKASLEIKDQLVAGAPLERADLSAVVTVNDTKQAIAQNYLN